MGVWRNVGRVMEWKRAALTWLAREIRTHGVVRGARRRVAVRAEILSLW